MRGKKIASLETKLIREQHPFFQGPATEIVRWGIRAMDGCVIDKNGTYGEDGIKLINFLISQEKEQST